MEYIKHLWGHRIELKYIPEAKVYSLDLILKPDVIVTLFTSVDKTEVLEYLEKPYIKQQVRRLLDTWEVKEKAPIEKLHDIHGTYIQFRLYLFLSMIGYKVYYVRTKDKVFCVSGDDGLMTTQVQTPEGRLHGVVVIDKLLGQALEDFYTQALEVTEVLDVYESRKRSALNIKGGIEMFLGYVGVRVCESCKLPTCDCKGQVKKVVQVALYECRLCGTQYTELDSTNVCPACHNTGIVSEEDT